MCVRFSVVFLMLHLLCYSVTLDGKDQAVEVKCMDSLVFLLKDLNTSVRANAAGAIMRWAHGHNFL